MFLAFPGLHLMHASAQGLRHHLEASHDFFDFGFAEDAPAVLPVVSVEPCDGLLAPGSQRFRAPDAATMRHAVSKVLRFQDIGFSGLSPKT